jgi:uncharacterized protein (DUF3084 family)
LKAQVENFASDNSSLRTQVDSLAAEVTHLKAEQAKAQELQLLHDKHRAEADSRKKDLQRRLQNIIDSLRGKF